MSTTSKIEWTDRTWNPTVGCSRVSPGCDNCYAERQARRHDRPGSPYEGTTLPGAKWSGRVNELVERVEDPLRWQRPSRVFVDSMSDLFHPDVRDEFLAEVFATMALAYRHTFQVLTKRPQRMVDLTNDPEFEDDVRLAIDRRIDANPNLRPAAYVGEFPRMLWPFANVWLGVSVESQRYVFRVRHLIEAKAAVRFVSAEPLLGPLDLADHLRPWPGYCQTCGVELSPPEATACIRGHSDYDEGPPPPREFRRPDWVIVGGESGPGARPMHPDWARSLRDQCQAARVAFLFKQWGEWAPNPEFGGGRGIPVVCRVGKKTAGRTLDGRTWDEYPEVTHP